MKNLLVITILSLSVLSVSYSQTKSLKRGICGDASPHDLATLAPYISWYYDWGVEPPSVSQGELSGIEWVPMQWGGISADMVENIKSRIPEGCSFLLGFNEPNFKSQANLTPQQAADMWPLIEQIASDLGLELVSPAVNWCGDCVDGVTFDPTDWLDKFIAACPDCHFDYIAIHNYAPYSAALKSYINMFRKYNKKIWITEFAPWDSPKPDFDGVVQYMKEVIPILENDTSIFRYSWFATRVNSNHDIDLLGADGELTKLGMLYTNMAFDGCDVSQLNPVAILPATKNINLPATKILLPGSFYFPDEDAVTLEWSQLSGPSTATFSNNTVAKPYVSDLELGTYVFQMTVRANDKSDDAQIVVQVNGSNIALGKPATSLSNQEGNEASKVNDGNLNTRWSSLDSDPQWIQIDLGSNYQLSGAKIIWENAFAKVYTIDVSTDDYKWETVYATSNGQGGTTEYTFNETARYIRMLSTQRNTQEQWWGNSIWEFEVYGSELVSINDDFKSKNYDIEIFPNPCTDGIINLKTNAILFGNELQCSVFNVLGARVFYKNVLVGSPVFQLNINESNNLTKGIYFLKIGGTNGFVKKKLIIE